MGNRERLQNPRRSWVQTVRPGADRRSERHANDLAGSLSLGRWFNDGTPKCDLEIRPCRHVSAVRD